MTLPYTADLDVFRSAVFVYEYVISQLGGQKLVCVSNDSQWVEWTLARTRFKIYDVINHTVLIQESDSDSLNWKTLTNSTHESIWGRDNPVPIRIVCIEGRTELNSNRIADKNNPQAGFNSARQTITVGLPFYPSILRTTAAPRSSAVLTSIVGTLYNWWWER